MKYMNTLNGVNVNEHLRAVHKVRHAIFTNFYSLSSVTHLGTPLKYVTHLGPPKLRHTLELENPHYCPALIYTPEI